MLRNYFQTALRNLMRQKASAAINLAGLTLGISSSLVLFILVHHHSGYDRYHSNFDRIYRIVTESDGNHERNYSSGVPALLPDAFRGDFPEAEEVTFIGYRSGSLITIPQRSGPALKFQEDQGVAFAESNFFKIFDRPLIAGTAAHALDEPGQAVLSKAAAIKYFGKTDAVGEIVRFEDRDFRVTAVMNDFPANTDFPFNVVLSYITVKTEREKEGWGSIWSDEQCYFLLKKNVKIEDVDRRLPDFYKKFHPDGNRTNQAFVTQPLSELHFDNRFGNFNYHSVSHQELVALSTVAILLILTACVNFVNLTTAEAIKRSKEVGIRKALGSTRGQLFRQFQGETLLVTLAAVVIAVAVAQLALGVLNPFLDLRLSIGLTTEPLMWAFLLAFTLVVATLSGFYPALVLSGFRVTAALKNQINMRNSSGFNLRRGLVVLQFVISQFLIIATVVLIKQMNFFHNTDLGFRKDAVVTVPVHEQGRRGQANNPTTTRTLRNELSRLSGVESASLSNSPPSSGSTSNTGFEIEGDEQFYRAQLKFIDDRYVNLYGLKLIAGRNVADLDSSQDVLVNEKLAWVTGFHDAREMIGKKIKTMGQTVTVIGVVADFHTVSLRDPIVPTLLLNHSESYNVISLKLNPTTLKETIRQVQPLWEALYPQHIFSYEFLDDQIREFYEGEERLSILLSVFTGLAIFIGCLGLFGLATFMANQKTKEVGVRKVLGASVESIVFLFSKEYIRLLLIGFVFAAPLAGYLSKRWLSEFAYQIDVGPSVFAICLLTTLAIAMATVGYRSMQAARANPAQSLKVE